MIDILSRTYWPETMGGAEKYIFELKNQLNNQFLFKVYSWNKSDDKDVVTINVPKIKFFGSMIFSLKASRLINKSASNLVHINQYWSEYSSFFLKKPFVSTIYDLPFNYIHKKIIKNCALKSKKIFYISDLIKKQLIKEGIAEEKFVYAPPGIDNKIRIKHKKIINNKEKIFLHISRLAPNKDIITIIKALSLLKEKIKFKFFVIGQKMEWTHYYQRIISEIKRLGLQKQVILLGVVDNKIKNKLLHSADIYLHASIYGEGFGMPIVEAQASGTPVITTKLFSELGIIKNNWNGLIFDSYDYQKLSKLIINLIKDNSFRKRLIKNGIIFSKRFDWKITFNNIAKVYKEYS